MKSGREPSLYSINESLCHLHLVSNRFLVSLWYLWPARKGHWYKLYLTTAASLFYIFDEFVCSDTCVICLSTSTFLSYIYLPKGHLHCIIFVGCMLRFVLSFFELEFFWMVGRWEFLSPCYIHFINKGFFDLSVHSIYGAFHNEVLHFLLHFELSLASQCSSVNQKVHLGIDGVCV